MAHNGQHQVGEIADLLGVSPPAASKNVDKLERLGLVVREPCKRDRRAARLSASAAGRHLVEAVEARKTERLTPVLAEFSTEELDQLSQLLERFAAALLAREESGLEPCLRCAAEFGDEGECAVARVLSVCPYREIRSLHAAQAAAGEP
jgi:DNA-binding MarR family transcriptional regulator